MFSFADNGLCSAATLELSAVGKVHVENNKGWRLVVFVAGALMLSMSIARVTVVSLEETPKHLVSVGSDADAVQTLQKIAREHGRPCSLTLEMLGECDGNAPVQRQKVFPARFLLHNMGSLFRSTKLALSTSMVWLSWALVGLGCPLFYMFLP